MANFKTVFLGTERSKTDSVEMQCYHNTSDEIYLELRDSLEMHNHNIQSICLDVSTAIKLSKTLRTHINLIKEL